MGDKITMDEIRGNLKSLKDWFAQIDLDANAYMIEATLTEIETQETIIKDLREANEGLYREYLRLGGRDDTRD